MASEADDQTMPADHHHHDYITRLMDGKWGDEAQGCGAIAYVASTDRTKHIIMPTGMATITIPANHKEAAASPY